MSDSSKDSKKSKSSHFKDIFETLPKIFRAELKSGFGKFNVIMALIALTLAIGFAFRSAPFENLLAFYVAIFVGLLSFMRSKRHGPKETRRPKSVKPPRR